MRRNLCKRPFQALKRIHKMEIFLLQKKKGGENRLRLVSLRNKRHLLLPNHSYSDSACAAILAGQPSYRTFVSYSLFGACS